MDIVNAYADMGTYRGAAALCGTTHKTVKRVLERVRTGMVTPRRTPPPRNTDGVVMLITDRVRGTDGRISAKRLLPLARAAGYEGSDRNLRRAVALAKAGWRKERRVYRPWVPVPGEYLVIDWTPTAGLQCFCAVLAWSRVRFVRFATDQRRETTLAMLAACLEELGGVPALVLSDRMACLKASVVANVVVPHPDYVRFATHYGFRPDFCEAADPESKGMVEHLAGYVQGDLVVPAGGWESVAVANEAAAGWCAEVNGRVHSEIAAVPGERLATERSMLRPLPSLRPPLRQGVLRKVDRLATIRIGAARYSVPARLVGHTVEVLTQDGKVVILRDSVEVARHALVLPGEVALMDAHYGGPAVRPSRGVRPRTQVELAFLSLGPLAERFLRAAAAAGTQRLETELRQILELEPIWGRSLLIAALERATQFRRFKAVDMRAILAAGHGVPSPVLPGAALTLPLPAVPVRPLSAYALEALR